MDEKNISGAQIIEGYIEYMKEHVADIPDWLARTIVFGFVPVYWAMRLCCGIIYGKEGFNKFKTEVVSEVIERI